LQGQLCRELLQMAQKKSKQEGQGQQRWPAPSSRGFFAQGHTIKVR